MADCQRCGGKACGKGGATKTEIHHKGGRVYTRIFGEVCRQRLRDSSHIANVIDLDPIDEPDKFLPKGPGTCGGCGATYDNVREHQQRENHPIGGSPVIDPYLPGGPGKCPVCRRGFVDVREHQKRQDHGAVAKTPAGAVVVDSEKQEAS